MATGSSEVFSLVEAVHTPYCQQLVQYPTMEGQLLRRQLHQLELVSLTVSQSVVSGGFASGGS